MSSKCIPCWLGAGLYLLMPLLTSSAQADLLVNGDFEVDPSPQFGITQITGWTVYAGTVDLVREPGVTSGLTCLETTGTPGAATIGQVLATTPGQLYLFHGLISHHAGLGEQTARIDMTINGQFVAQLTHGGVQTTPTDYHWQPFDVQFVAPGATTDLRLQDVTNLYAFGGGIIDALSITPVPEPTTQLAAGAAAAWALRRPRAGHRRARSAQ